MGPNCEGRTSLHIAAIMPHCENHRETLRTLPAVGGRDIDRPRLGDGFNASHIAIVNKDHECLEVCLELGVDPEVENIFDATPQQMAYEMCDGDEMHPLVRLIRRNGSPSSEPSVVTVTNQKAPSSEKHDIKRDACVARDYSAPTLSTRHRSSSNKIHALRPTRRR